MSVSEYVSIVKNPYVNIQGFDKTHCCENLMLNNIGVWYCEKYREIIGDGNMGAMRVMTYCRYYYSNHNCWLDVCKKMEQERAEKERQEREKIEAEEKALFEKQKAMCDYMIQQDPNNSENYRLRGGTYCQRRLYDQAMADLNEAIRLDPKDAENYAFRGEIFFETNENNRALDDFNRAIQLNPKCKNAFMFRAGFYAEKKEHDKAISDYEEAVRIAPNEEIIKTLLENARTAKRNELEQIEKERKETRRSWTAFLLCLFLGCLGVHRFFVKKIGTGILYLITLGFFGIGVIIDLFRIAYGNFDDTVDETPTGGKVICWVWSVLAVSTFILSLIFG